MTYRTPENPPNINAIDYQIALAFDNYSRIAMATKFVRLDAEYGFTGFNVPACHSELWSSSLAMDLETYREEGSKRIGYVVKDRLSFGCDVYRKTGKDQIPFIMSCTTFYGPVHGWPCLHNIARSSTASDFKPMAVRSPWCRNYSHLGNLFITIFRLFSTHFRTSPGQNF